MEATNVAFSTQDMGVACHASSVKSSQDVQESRTREANGPGDASNTHGVENGPPRFRPLAHAGRRVALSP